MKAYAFQLSDEHIKEIVAAKQGAIEHAILLMKRALEKFNEKNRGR